MPELPEVETTRSGLAPWVEGAKLQGVEVRNAGLRWPVVEKDLNKLVGGRVQSLERRAKYLLFNFPERSLLLHLGMSGSMRILDPREPVKKHDHLDFLFKRPGEVEMVMRFNDPRRFGCCLVINPPISEHSLLRNLGPEPLSASFDGDHLYQRARGKKVAVKNFIMDGHVVVGVGNIYASEALFLAGISPGTAAGRLSRPKYRQLALAIQSVLEKAIKAGGTTLSDFSQSDGQPGYFKQELQVYGRAGEPCYRCSAVIRSRVLGQRNTYYCSSCQR